jgi:hypothetical protein
VSTRNILRAAKNDCLVILTTYRKKKANVSMPTECGTEKGEIPAA